MPVAIDRAVRAVARWSYSLYLTQLVIFRVLSWALGWNAATPLTCLLEAITFGTLSIIAAALVYRLVERPVLRWRDSVT